jgi:hypothetical protein
MILNPYFLKSEALLMKFEKEMFQEFSRRILKLFLIVLLLNLLKNRKELKQLKKT